MDLLKDIEEDLGKGEDNCPHVGIICTAQQAGQITKKLWTKHNRNQNVVKDRLRRIKNAIKL